MDGRIEQKSFPYFLPSILDLLSGIGKAEMLGQGVVGFVLYREYEGDTKALTMASF